MEERWPGRTFQIYPARLRPIPIFYGTPNFPIFFNQTINSSQYQTSMAATNMFEPGWILISFIEDHLGDPKQFDPARLKPIPILYGTPNFHIIFNLTINSSPSQTSMAATNMFEAGWILISFIENRLRNLKLFEPTRLIPIHIFYGTPNFPIFFVQTINSSPSQTSMAATNTFEPSWILTRFHWVSSTGRKTIQSSPAQDLSPFSMERQTSLFSCVQTINSSPSQTSMAATNMFGPGWILIGSIEDQSRGPKTIWSSPAQAHSHFLWDANLPCNLCSNNRILLHLKPSMAATNTFEPGWILIGFIEDRLEDTKQFNPARLRPIPIFSMERQTSLFSCVQTINSSPPQTSMAATNMFEPGWILIGLI